MLPNRIRNLMMAQGPANARLAAIIDEMRLMADEYMNLVDRFDIANEVIQGRRNELKATVREFLDIAPQVNRPIITIISEEVRAERIPNAGRANPVRGIHVPFGEPVVFRGFNPVVNNMDNDIYNEDDEIEEDRVKKVMKMRHLSKGEREALHHPKSDWEQSKRGDTLKSASSLDVSDLISKHIK